VSPRVRTARRWACRLGGDDLVLTDRWPLQDKVADDVEQLLTANSAFTDHAVATWRAATRVGTLTVGSTRETYDDPAFARLVHRCLRARARPARRGPVAGRDARLRAIVHEHAVAIGLTEGLRAGRRLRPGTRRGWRGGGGVC
jgi:hypothetical protein